MKKGRDELFDKIKGSSNENEELSRIILELKEAAIENESWAFKYRTLEHEIEQKMHQQELIANEYLKKIDDLTQINARCKIYLWWGCIDMRSWRADPRFAW